MKMLTLLGLLVCPLILTQPSYAQQSATPPQPRETQSAELAEKIRDASPNKKFAMRVRYDAEMYQKMFPMEKNDTEKTPSTLQQAINEQYFPATIQAIELVSLPQKLVVAELPWDGGADRTSLIWSRDSKWCAFYSSTARWGLTWIYHLLGDKFVGENVQPGADVEGDAHGT
jgi:hypothetical protein